MFCDLGWFRGYVEGVNIVYTWGLNIFGSKADTWLKTFKNYIERLENRLNL